MLSLRNIRLLSAGVGVLAKNIAFLLIKPGYAAIWQMLRKLSMTGSFFLFISSERE